MAKKVTEENELKMSVDLSFSTDNNQYLIFEKPEYKMTDYIEGNINDAKAKNEKASEYLLESEKQAKEAAKQYKEIIDQAKEDAVKAKSKIMDEANKQAQEKIEQARHEIESEKLAAQDEMKKEIVDVAVEVATKVMDQNMNTEANKALVDDFVKQVIN